MSSISVSTNPEHPEKQPHQNAPAPAAPPESAPLTTHHSPLTPDEWTLGRLLDWTAQYLADKGCEFPRLDAEVLLAHVLGGKRIELYTRYDELASAEVRTRYRELVRRRVEGCPVAYLVGRKEFYALELEVGPPVLIPRPDSEFAVMECLRLAKYLARPRVLDIGTGSGNLVIAVAKNHRGAEATAIDLSADALAVARRNTERHDVANRIRFLQGDLFEPLPAGERFDFILSNPPYIPHDDIAGLPIGVRDYEPHLALDGGPGGYQVIERILARAGDFLEPGGHLIVEIGAPQEAEVRQRFTQHPGFELAPTIFDYSRHPRVLSARWQGQ